MSITAAQPTPAGNDDHPVVSRFQRDVTLAQGAMQGAAWIGPSRIAAHAAQFLAMLVTARLLTPSQFGEAAIVLAVANFAMLFTDLGLSAAVIHAKRATGELLSTAFWLNLLTGVVLTGAAVVIAYPLSRVYDQPDLVGLMALAGLNFTLSCGVVHLAILERTFNFRRLALIEIAGACVGAAVTPLAAWAGAGSASLLLGPLVTTTLTTILLWVTVRWWPDRRPSRSALAQLWRFSRGLVGFNVLAYWSRNLDTLALGKVVSTGQLGEYTRAYSLTLIPVTQMTLVVSRVVYPALARLQDDAQRMGRAWTKALSAAGALTVPATVTLAATAPALVVVLLGANWSGMVPELTLLAISTMPQIIVSSTGVVFRAAGRTAVMLQWGIFGTILTLSSILVGLHWGTVGVAAALAIRWWLALPITLMPISRITHLSIIELLRPVYAMLLPAAGLAAGELAVRYAVPDTLPAIVVLIAQLVAGAIGYGVVLARTQPDTLRMVIDRASKLRRRLAVRTTA